MNFFNESVEKQFSTLSKIFYFVFKVLFYLCAVAMVCCLGAILICSAFGKNFNDLITIINTITGEETIEMGFKVSQAIWYFVYNFAYVCVGFILSWKFYPMFFTLIKSSPFSQNIVNIMKLCSIISVVGGSVLFMLGIIIPAEYVGGNHYITYGIVMYFVTLLLYLKTDTTTVEDKDKMAYEQIVNNLNSKGK